MHDAEVALIEARDGNYDMLLLDVELPRMDGCFACRFMPVGLTCERSFGYEKTASGY